MLGRKFIVGTDVVFNNTVGQKDIVGKPAGKIVGYSSGGFPIVLLPEVDAEGDLAHVYHDSILDEAS